MTPTNRVFKLGIVNPRVMTLVLKDTVPKAKRKMFCINCGGYLEITYKKIVLIIEGTSAESEITAELKCFKCNTVYEIC